MSVTLGGASSRIDNPGPTPLCLQQGADTPGQSAISSEVGNVAKPLTQPGQDPRAASRPSHSHRFDAERDAQKIHRNAVAISARMSERAAALPDFFAPKRVPEPVRAKRKYVRGSAWRRVKREVVDDETRVLRVLDDVSYTAKLHVRRLARMDTSRCSAALARLVDAGQVDAVVVRQRASGSGRHVTAYRLVK